ncbi:hypothetical protein [Comamonas jiangduensis]|uniref:Uncharacterized protein n=1 Tax=Comamonas jiangduensis TaxID=1194168 RepID=A0ABV4IFL7_9BURK
MIVKQTNEYDDFIDAFVDEMIATPDEQILEGLDAHAVQTNALQLLNRAKSQASRSRLAAAKAGYTAARARSAATPINVSALDARKFIALAANDGRFTLAARNLSELSDDEVVALYSRLKSLETDCDGEPQ